MKKIALKDIAQQAGVSKALVSYVLNDKEEEKRVGKEMAIKIRKIAEELGYRPNQIARSLKTNKTFTIGLIVANINYRFTTGVTSAIEAEAKKNNYTVLFGSSDESAEKLAELVTVLIDRQVDGLIIVPVENSENTILSLKSSHVPFVLIDRNFPQVKTNYIGIDNLNAAYMSVKHLVKLGHRKIGLINYKTSFDHLQQRSAGYLKALKDANLPSLPDWRKEIRNNFIQADIDRSIEKLINSAKVDAIFFGTDTLAIYGLKKINQMGKRVPEDIAVVSFDESDAFDLFYCPVTHARQPLSEIGKLSVHMLLEMMKGKSNNKQVLLESDFVIGKSCGEGD